MSSFDKAITVSIDDIKYFESDLDVILAASTISDHVTVRLSEDVHKSILENKVYAKQFSSLPEFGVNVIISKAPTPTSVMYIKRTDLINYDELVDLLVHSQDGIPDGSTR